MCQELADLKGWRCYTFSVSHIILLAVFSKLYGLGPSKLKLHFIILESFVDIAFVGIDLQANLFLLCKGGGGSGAPCVKSMRKGSFLLSDYQFSVNHE
jgi:hypothetical protein